MYLGSNLQYLRKLNGNMTQEKLAERMNVSRQTVSKWESEESYPDVAKLVELCELFSCKIDALLREDMAAADDVFSPVRIERVEAFRMARYVMITPQPENDVNAYMDRWAQDSGLMDIPGPEPKRIGWDFPYTSAEQKNRFGLRGYVAAYILPDGFEPRCGGVEIAGQGAADYAVLTIRNPFECAFDRIPRGYRRILEHLKCNGFKENRSDEYLACFEHVYACDGVEYMDVYIHTDSVSRGNLHTGFE